MAEARVFDRPHYRSLDRSRIDLLRGLLGEWKRQLGLGTAIDVGCGVGHFSSLLQELGFRTVALDGRQDNAEEARRRAPGVKVHVADVEDPAIQQFGTFDLVLCFGLLYHLENPFRSIRNLRELTGKVLVIESMCIDEGEPALHLRDEGPTEDQGLRHIAFYPTEACLVKMLYRAGFPAVYRLTRLPDHADFHASAARRRVRTMLVAARVPLESECLVRVSEPETNPDPWRTGWASVQEQAEHMGSFLTKPWPEKMATLRRRLGWHEK
jgi:tRNA (mo5U34)-methyltransferase